MAPLFAICFPIISTAILLLILAPSQTIIANSEAEALISSGWWSSHYTKNNSDHCHWPAITCAGLVVEIALTTTLPIGAFHGDRCSITTNTSLLSFNSLTGVIPTQIGALSQLRYLILSFSSLTGAIPTQIGALSNIRYLYLSPNNLTGMIPIEIGALSQLTELDLSSNNLTGAIPTQIGALSQLTYLDLSFNNLTGVIPTQIGALSQLIYLDFSRNNLTGEIPSELVQLPRLRLLKLSSNQISGQIPVDIGQLSQLRILELSSNNLSGFIPFQIAYLPLQKIDLSQNSIQGTITSAFGSIGTSGYNEVLLLVNLSHNNLSGAVPRALLELGTVDLSYNALEGPIPIDIRCELPKCVLFPNGKLFKYSASTTSSNKEASNTNYTLIFVLVAVFFGLLFLGGGFFLFKIKAKKSNQEPLVTNEGDIFKIWNFNGKIAYEDIVRATEDFEISYCIGTGGYGSVYRAELPNGRVVALKKLHRMEGENPTYDKCFRNEAEILQGIRHQNIVKLFGYCLHKRCMFLIYEYVERGSLFCILRDENEAVELDWMKRVNVVKGVAHALSYMHHDCNPPILHRDVLQQYTLGFKARSTFS
ncbi:MDIS1-interacting receptor like kinase [Sesamum angolense]|uniref:non-specific serine/threonine protein kinase n=1 Tax=Sesamum angolense TaxID=2727404 RepID=A0AAE1W712_9LAMI|nr:MDIS1-interacting receptor like kinase [Sesamum angolense]